jgi:hypothetical protein
MAQKSHLQKRYTLVTSVYRDCSYESHTWFWKRYPGLTRFPSDSELPM